MAVLSIKNLSKKFARAEKFALKDFSLNIKKGELVAVLGESGCGKTTLLRLIAGFEDPTAGEIWLNGELISGKGSFLEPERRGIGKVFQDYALFPHLNVFHNIAFGLHKYSKFEKVRKVKEIIELVGISDIETQYPHELSGGQKQRVAIARALAPQPALLLLDEPFSNIDTMLKNQMRDDICKIIRQTETTCIFVSHDTKDVLAIADRVALLKEGELKQVDSPPDIYMYPKDSYVAKFFGKTNIIHARVAKGGFETPIGFLKSNAEIPCGVTEVLLSIRPESFELQNEPANCICGNLKQVNFRGEYKEIVCSVPDGNNKGTDVTLYVTPDSPCHDTTCFFKARQEQIQVLECLR
jgi:iron(III) transport system ATP-binding protein